MALRAFRTHLDIQPSLARRAVDGAVDIQLFGCPVARKAAQAAHGDLDVAGAEFAGVVEILEFALFPDFDRAFMLRFTANADALGIVTGITIGRCPAGTDPFISALMPLFLLFEPLFQRIHQLVPATHLFDFGHFFGRQIFFGNRLQPVGRNVDRDFGHIR